MGFDFDRLISVVLDSIAPDLLKYDMIFLIGEAGAGKTTIMNILRGKGFNEEYNATDIGEVSRPFLSIDSRLKIIKVIDTSGSNLKSLPRWKEKDYTIRCFIFDTTQFYKGKKIDKTLSEIDEKVKIKKLYHDGIIRRINKSYLYCYLNHPEVDILNRKRIGLVIWDENDSEEIIIKTIEAIGLDINQWKKSYETYKNEFPESKKNLIIGMAVAAIIIIVIKIIKG